MARTSMPRKTEDVDDVTLTSEDVDDVEEDDESLQGEGSPSDSASLKSETATPPPPPSRSPSKGKANGEKKPGPQLIGHLPRAEDEAMRVFEELKGNHYQYSTLGRSREALESMTCDCQFVAGEDDPYIACGDGSDCINRLTQVECVEGDCRCRGYCQNQRMQKRQHADLHVVLTEKKGFGLRAATDIDKDAFIYEYIGDVVSQPTFAKRMRDYADEGIRHFYFMMLQKDEFIDATKRGGIGRFANHSCNPNCFVAKWTVGKHVRMGIYAKRCIRKDEELTFNYNVDRYGHEAQPCYCGEPNCVGFLGGKTQTDVAAMDDLYLDALGITDEVEMYGLKGNKKKKGKKLDEDYSPILKALSENDIPKVVQAIRQTQSRKVLLKLLSRIKLTEDQSALRQLMRLRGFSLMCNILEDYIEDVEICTVVLEGISNWPLLQRNKIVDSKIEDHVQQLGQSNDDHLKELSEKLISHWATLEVGYRIPKRQIKDDGHDARDLKITSYETFVEESVQAKRKRLVQEYEERISARMNKWEKWGTPSPPPPLRRKRTPERKVSPPPTPPPKPPPKPAPKPPRKPTPTPSPEPEWTPKLPKLKDPIVVKEEVVHPKREDALSLIETLRLETEKAQEAAAAEAKRAAEAAKKAADKEREKHRKKSTHLSEEEKEALKEKKLQKLVGAVVVKCMSKYRDQMSHDEFKENAKELTQLISDKEKKSQSYQSGKLDALSEEKTAKIKKFAKEYISKLLRRIGKSKSSVTASLAPASSGTPLSDSGSGTARSGSNTLVELDALDLDKTPDFDGGEPHKINGHGKEDLMDVDAEHSENATPATPKRSRWDQPPPSSTSTVRSPAKDPRARPDLSKNGTQDVKKPPLSS